MDDQVLILNERDVAALLVGRQEHVCSIIENTYRLHATNQCVTPQSSFLRFPESSRDRIIALPAYVGGPSPAAGIKWISSFPGNVKRGLERAAAVIVLNSTSTGRPWAILDGALISAQRTAASAALAARKLHPADDGRPIGVVGCGRINFEIVNFLTHQATHPLSTYLFDVDQERAELFEQKLNRLNPSESRAINKVCKLEDILIECGLISFATTATEPYLSQWKLINRHTTLLHISLRDIPPDAILEMDNVVDDIDHVFSAGTSIHLAEKIAGNRSFVRTTLGQILLGAVPARGNGDSVTAFSPFGLGILDVALADYVAHLALEEGLGTSLDWY
jgi:2,3-diaminopropionate biosynthesis protein SbnB